MKIKTLLFYLLIFTCSHGFAQRSITIFNKDWKFFLGNDSAAIRYNFDDTKWRTVNLPHDWSIEGKFSKNILLLIMKALCLQALAGIGKHLPFH